MEINNKLLLGLIILLAVFIRLIPLDFPQFTADDARIAYRGYVLATEGKDELGRTLPLVFNSLDDYQLPVVSYVTALGVLIFGKTDSGVRIPFILIGTAVILFIYELSRIFLKDERFSLYAAAVAGLSPGLIFFSKFPNEFIITTFLMLVLIVKLFEEKIRILRLLVIILLLLLTSKLSWFILIPVLLLTIYLNNQMQKKTKIILLAFGLVSVFLAVVIFLAIPQGQRSLTENNFSIVNDVTVKNSIEKIRGQTIPGWPVFLDRILFNKAYVVVAGIFYWLSQINLSKLFAELDPGSSYGYLKTGAFSKIAIIPFVTGLIFLIKESRRIKFLIFYIILVTFPLIFLYPSEQSGLILPALPFIVLISALSCQVFGRKILTVLLILLTLEWTINLWFIQASILNANDNRPGWIREIIKEADAYSANNVVFSDDIVNDLAPFIEWYTKFNPTDGYENIKFPYR